MLGPKDSEPVESVIVVEKNDGVVDPTLNVVAEEDFVDVRVSGKRIPSLDVAIDGDECSSALFVGIKAAA